MSKVYLQCFSNVSAYVASLSSIPQLPGSDSNAKVSTPWTRRNHADCGASHQSYTSCRRFMCYQQGAAMGLQNTAWPGNTFVLNGFAFLCDVFFVMA